MRRKGSVHPNLRRGAVPEEPVPWRCNTAIGSSIAGVAAAFIVVVIVAVVIVIVVVIPTTPRRLAVAAIVIVVIAAGQDEGQRPCNVLRERREGPRTPVNRYIHRTPGRKSDGGRQRRGSDKKREGL